MPSQWLMALGSNLQHGQVRGYITDVSDVQSPTALKRQAAQLVLRRTGLNGDSPSSLYCTSKGLQVRPLINDRMYRPSRGLDGVQQKSPTPVRHRV